MNKATILITKNLAGVLPAVNAAYKQTVITVTGGDGVAQAANVNGTESPAWTAVFLNVANGNCVASAQDQDANGLAIGTPLSTPFTEAGVVAPTLYPQTTGISVTVS